MSKTKSLLFAGAGVILLAFSSRRAKAGVIDNRPRIPPFTENRVYIRDFGNLPRSSPLLVPVPTYPHAKGQQYLHVLAAKRLKALSKAAARDGFPDIKIASGWRPHAWTSWDQYVDFVTRKYGSLAEGRKKVAYNSPHETGLAIDFGYGGVAPYFKAIDNPFGLSNAQQKQTPFYKWLVKNAHKFGLTPYKYEAWHWEVNIPKYAWETGQDFTRDYGVLA